MKTISGMRQMVLRIGSALAFLGLGGCTHFQIEDCPGTVLGRNDPGSARLRTSHYRVMLQDPPMAAARFLPLAIMSSYAYQLGAGCLDPGNASGEKASIDADRAKQLRAFLDEVTGPEKWSLVQLEASLTPVCEDDQGLMFHVWERTVGDQTHVAIAFRGTSGDGDWQYGNLWPVTQLFYSDNQLTRASNFVTRIIAYYHEKTSRVGRPEARFFSTGHSLGGGLAQHVLYTHPAQIEQAIVFDPSSVTGFSSLPANQQMQGCACMESLGNETRIIRVYQTYEVLANLRIFHKTFLPPERHVSEVRFPYPASWNIVARHSMGAFVDNLQRQAKPYIGGEDVSIWYAAKEEASSNSSCTIKMIDGQKNSCKIPASDSLFGRCPQ